MNDMEDRINNLACRYYNRLGLTTGVDMLGWTNVWHNNILVASNKPGDNPVPPALVRLIKLHDQLLEQVDQFEQAVSLIEIGRDMLEQEQAPRTSGMDETAHYRGS